MKRYNVVKINKKRDLMFWQTEKLSVKNKIHCTCTYFGKGKKNAATY